MATIGILLPRSSFYGGISFDIYEGLRASLKQWHREDIEICSENIGFGADKQECYRAAEQLLLHKKADLVLAYIGHRTAQLLRPLFTAAHKTLLVLDAGSHMPQEWPTSPNIFYLSLHNALGMWLSAAQAARAGHHAAAVVSCFYDGGYLQTHALSLGYQSAGGKVAFNHATGHKRQDFSLKPLFQHLENNDTRCLLTILSGDFVHWYFEELKEAKLSAEISIYTGPFALEEEMLRQAPYPNLSIQGIASWASTLLSPENKAFKQGISAVGRQANLFSLLGWEAGILSLEILRLQQLHSKPTSVAEGLKTFEYDSPRGRSQVDPKTHHTLSPMYKAKVVDDGSGHCKLEVRDKILFHKEAFEQLSSEPLGQAVSGWYNSYTCI